MAQRTQFTPIHTSRDDTRDAAIDLFALIGAAQRALANISVSNELQNTLLRKISDALDEAQGRTRQFVDARVN